MPNQSQTVSPGPDGRSVRAAGGEVLRPPGDWVLLPPGDAGLTRRVKVREIWKAEGGIRTLNPRFTKAVLCH